MQVCFQEKGSQIKPFYKGIVSMLNILIPIVIMFGVFSIFQYAFVITKLWDGEYETQRDFLIAAIPGKFLFNSVVFVITLKNKFDEIPKSMTDK